jgi:hypothetical protein
MVQIHLSPRDRYNVEKGKEGFPAQLETRKVKSQVKVKQDNQSLPVNIIFGEERCCHRGVAMATIELRIWSDQYSPGMRTDRPCAVITPT